MRAIGPSALANFFWTLKIERTASKVYRTANEARADVVDHITHFYNPRRRHSKLGYISPMEFEVRAKPVHPAVHQTGSGSKSWRFQNGDCLMGI